MRNVMSVLLVAAVLAALFVPTDGVSGAPAQQIPGYELVETVPVEASGMARTAQTVFQTGVLYYLVAKGTMQNGPLLSDAEFIITGASTGEDTCQTVGGSVVDVGIGMNDATIDSFKSPKWYVQFIPGSEYTITFNTSGPPFAGVFNYHDCDYGDNSNSSLRVEIWQPLPVTPTPTATPAVSPTPTPVPFCRVITRQRGVFVWVEKTMDWCVPGISYTGCELFVNSNGEQKWVNKDFFPFCDQQTPSDRCEAVARVFGDEIYIGKRLQWCAQEV